MKKGKILSKFFPFKEPGKEAKKAAKFAALAFLSLLLLLILTSLVPLEWIELAVAKTVLNALAATGAKGSIAYGEPVTIFLEETSIEISYLCTGLLETMVLASVVLASAGISIKKRITGALAGIPATFAVNIFRILATLHFVQEKQQATAELIHNVFFRVALFVTIFVFYAVWFRWATGVKSKK